MPDHASPDWLSRYRSAIQYRDLRLLLGAVTVSTTGNWAYNVVLLAYVFERTHSYGWVSAAGVARLVPFLLLGPYGGVLADRVERVRLLVCSDLVCVVWQAGLAAAAAAGEPIALALTFAALTSATTVVFNPAVGATIPLIVSGDDLVAANTFNLTTEHVVRVAGPAIGAVMLLLSSPALVFTLNATSFLFSAMLISRVRVRSNPAGASEPGTTPLDQLLVGLRTILRVPAARTFVSISVCLSFLLGADSVLFLSVSERRLGTGAAGLGYLLAGLGVGGIAVAPLVDRLARMRHRAQLITAGFVVNCLLTAPLAVITSPIVAVTLQVVRGGSTILADVLTDTTLQQSVPTDQLARVFGVFWALIVAGLAGGTAVTAPLISGLGVNGALLMMAFAPLAVALIAFPRLAAADHERHHDALAATDVPERG